MNCCDKISSEHYISESILQQIRPFTVRGLPGRLDNMKDVPPAALTANVLCKRHNSSLSSLDQAAGRSFSKIIDAEKHLRCRGTVERQARHFLVDGYALELWAIKSLAAMHFAGVSKVGGNPTKSGTHFDADDFIEALWRGRLENPLGFYLLDKEERPALDLCLYAPLVSQDDSVMGLEVHWGMLSFEVITKAPSYGTVSSGLHRPALIIFRRGIRSSIVHLAWSGVKSGDRASVISVP